MPVQPTTNPGVSDTCPCIPEVRAQVAADGCRGGTANMAVPIYHQHNRRREQQNSAHVMLSAPEHARFFISRGLCGFYTSGSAFPSRMHHTSTCARTETKLLVSDLHSGAPPEPPFFCTYRSLAFIGIGALPGRLHGEIGFARAALHEYVRDSSADCCFESFKPITPYSTSHFREHAAVSTVIEGGGFQVPEHRCPKHKHKAPAIASVWTICTSRLCMNREGVAVTLDFPMKSVDHRIE